MTQREKYLRELQSLLRRKNIRSPLVREGLALEKTISVAKVGG